MDNLSKTEEQILRNLALKGEKTSYDLSIREKIASRSTVDKAFKKLGRMKLIEVKREEKFKIPNKNKKYYGITFRGIIAALKNEGVSLNRIKSYDKLVISWINEAEERIKKLPNGQIVEGFSIYKEDLDNKEGFEYQKEIIIDYLKTKDERTELFLKHFDLEYSNNELIFQQLLYEANSCMIQSLYDSQEEKKT
jgi:hypothetical protein